MNRDDADGMLGGITLAAVWISPTWSRASCMECRTRTSPRPGKRVQTLSACAGGHHETCTYGATREAPTTTLRLEFQRVKYTAGYGTSQLLHTQLEMNERIADSCDDTCERASPEGLRLVDARTSGFSSRGFTFPGMNIERPLKCEHASLVSKPCDEAHGLKTKMTPATAVFVVYSEVTLLRLLSAICDARLVRSMRGRLRQAGMWYVTRVRIRSTASGL